MQTSRNTLPKPIPPASETRQDAAYPPEFRPWTARPDVFKKLRGRIPSGYTKDVLEYLCDLTLSEWKAGRTYESVTASDWQHTWKETCRCVECEKRGIKKSVIELHTLGTPPVNTKDVADKLGCSVRTVQNALSDGWEIGATARRKVGKHYAYTLLFEDFHRVKKADEPISRRGPIAVDQKQPAPEREHDARPVSGVRQRIEPVPDQASEYRFEFDSQAGETTRIRVIKIGEEKENVSRNFLRANEVSNSQVTDSNQSNSEPKPDPLFSTFAPENAQEREAIIEAITALKSRSMGPLSYTTVAKSDYVQVTIFDRSKKGVMPSESVPISKHGTGVEVAAGNSRRDAILAAIPKDLLNRFGPPGTVLMGQIEANLRGAPPEMLTGKIESSWDKITSTGILRNFADEVGLRWLAEQSGEVVVRPAKKTPHELKMESVSRMMRERGYEKD